MRSLIETLAERGLVDKALGEKAYVQRKLEELAAEMRKPEPIEWIDFKGRQIGRFAAAEPRITLNRQCGFYLNNAAFCLLGEPRFVELKIDKMHRTIGMRATDEQNKSRFRVKPHGSNGRNKTIQAGAFCQQFDIQTRGATLLFNDVCMGDDGVLRLGLVTATKVGRGAR